MDTLTNAARYAMKKKIMSVHLMEISMVRRYFFKIHVSIVKDLNELYEEKVSKFHYCVVTYGIAYVDNF